MNFKWYHKITDLFQFGGKGTWNRIPRYEKVDFCLGVKNAEKVNVNCEGTGEKRDEEVKEGVFRSLI